MAAAAAGEPFFVKDFICNAHRAVGARLGGELGVRAGEG